MSFAATADAVWQSVSQLSMKERIIVALATWILAHSLKTAVEEWRSISQRDTKQRSSGGSTMIQGKAKEDMVELAIRQRRQSIYLTAPKLDLEAKTYPKTDSEKQVILKAVKSNFVFANMSKDNILGLSLYLEPQKIKAGTDVVIQEETADFFYIVKEGTFDVFQSGKKIGNLTAGASFGETGLLHNTVRNATVRAKGDGSVWKLDRDTFRSQLAAMNVKISASLSESLKSMTILKGLTDEKLQQLIQAAVEVNYNQGQVIVKRGEKGLLGFFVMDGTVRVTDLPEGIDDVVYGPGEHFGLQALLTDEPRNATVVADTNVVVAAISASDVGHLLSEIQNIVLQVDELREIKCVPLFSQFSEEMLTSLIAASTKKQFKQGEYIVREGEVGTAFYLIQKGQCEVVSVDEQGNKTTVKKLAKLSYFGEMALLGDSKRRADVVASTDCTLLEMEKVAFNRMFGSSDRFSRHLTEIVNSRNKALRMVKSPPQKITLEELELVKVLGQGTFGRVSLAKHPKTELFYAVKEMSIEFIETHRQEANIVGEKEAMFQCDHPFILKLYATFKARHTLTFLLEFCSGGEMYDLIHKKYEKSVPEEHAKFYAACEVLALEHLACRQMAYRDMKPENTMIDEDGYGKMIDMGFAKVIKGKSYTFCGTPEYMAPEIILGAGHNRGVDYFALGVLIYEMIAGQTPFFDYSTDGVLRNIARGKFRFGPKFSDKLKALIEGLLTADPNKRLGMRKEGVSGIIQDPWFAGINFDALVQKKVVAPWIPTNDTSAVDADGPSGHLSTIDETYESRASWLNNF